MDKWWRSRVVYGENPIHESVHIVVDIPEMVENSAVRGRGEKEDRIEEGEVWGW